MQKIRPLPTNQARYTREKLRREPVGRFEVDHVCAVALELRPERSAARHRLAQARNGHLDATSSELAGQIQQMMFGATGGKGVDDVENFHPYTPSLLTAIRSKDIKVPLSSVTRRVVSKTFSVMRNRARLLVRWTSKRMGSSVPITDRPPPGLRPEDRFVPQRYRVQSPSSWEDSAPGEVSEVLQPDVYLLADALARLGAGLVIDIGCGKGGKLVELSRRHDVIGIDIGANIAYCRSQHPFGRWIEHDLCRSGPLPLQDVALRGSVVVCADVIEHLADPLPLLRHLRVCADRGACVLLSTPERALVRGRWDKGPPFNRAHVREWTIGELRALLVHVGFEIAFLGLTANSSIKRELSTAIAVLRSS
jgi:2-polyprenyl-3-methyl-5-hydroxy-6-metoxy-1,4-benzoquinol methylase